MLDTNNLDTPVPVVDMPTVKANIERLQNLCDRAGVSNRPHIKTHKSVEVAKLQLSSGAQGITCQKLGEAEVMADAGFDDILISYNILGPAKRSRLANLAQRTTLTVAADNRRVIEDISAAMDGVNAKLGVLIECETGNNRCGVASPREAVELAKLVVSNAKLHFRGLMVYPPRGDTRATNEFLAHARSEFDDAGLEIEVVSSGGTPNMASIGQCGETEYRSGTSVYNDRMMIGFNVATHGDCALHVYSTIISHPTPGRIILDAGSKALTSDLGGYDTFGILPDYPEAKITTLYEEHGVVDVSSCRHIPAIGEVVRILPNHVCPVSNLFDEVLCLEETGLLRSLRIDARGKTA